MGRGGERKSVGKTDDGEGRVWVKQMMGKEECG